MNIFHIFSLKEKTILLTGATGHLGTAMAWGLAQAGATVLVNSRSTERCDDLVNDLRANGLNAENASFDINDSQAIRDFFSARKNQPLHGIINNAYAGGAGTIETSESDSYINSYNLSVVCTERLFRHALPLLRLSVENTGAASIVNVASMYGLVSPDLRIYANAKSANPPFYGAAKAALIQWTRYAACEFGLENIRFNSISPGPFPSKSVQNNSPDFVNELNRKVPLNRIGHPDEIQGIVIFLMSSASSYITGENISIDGGWTIW